MQQKKKSGLGSDLIFSVCRVIAYRKDRGLWHGIFMRKLSGFKIFAFRLSRRYTFGEFGQYRTCCAAVCAGQRTLFRGERWFVFNNASVTTFVQAHQAASVVLVYKYLRKTHALVPLHPFGTAVLGGANLTILVLVLRQSLPPLHRRRARARAAYHPPPPQQTNIATLVDRDRLQALSPKNSTDITPQSLYSLKTL